MASEPRGEYVAFKVTRAEKAHLTAQARASGKTVSEYVRTQALAASASSSPQDVLTAASYLANTVPNIEAVVREARAFLTSTTGQDKEIPDG